MGTFLLVLIFVSSCESPASKERNVDYFFSIERLLEQQMEQWSQTKPILHKTLTLDGNTEAISSTPQNAEEWQLELSLLMEADLNKASLKDAYQVKEEKRAEEVITTYLAIEPKEVRVQKMVIRRGTSGHLKDILLLFSERNSIYTSDRKMKLEFNEVGEMVSYTIEGVQKMIFKDPIPYSLKAEIKNQ